jgi:putative membrane protein
MDTPAAPRAAADVRDYLAEERTFLAWIRTGLGVMAFGFVVARFGLFLEQIRIAEGGSPAEPHQRSLWFGTALIAAGVAVNILSARRHSRLIAALNHDQIVSRGPSRLAVVLAFFLALVGIAMVVYINAT